jgi:hypothetical protein
VYTASRLRAAEEPLKAGRKSLAIRLPNTTTRHSDREAMEALENFEHRAVLVLEQAPGDVNVEIWRDAHEILVERTVVNGAETEPVADERLAALLDVADDVCSIEQADFLQSADCAAVAVRR